MLAGGGLTLGAAIVQPVSQHKLSGGILFDEAVRHAVRPDGTPRATAFAMPPMSACRCS